MKTIFRFVVLLMLSLVFITGCDQPNSEICDGIDNDEDGAIDESIAPTVITCGLGACASIGQRTCVGGQLIDSCTPGAPSQEVCDNIDNDCNGLVDDTSESGCPSPPTNVQASDLGSTLPYVAITWNPCQYTTHYKIYKAIWEADAEYELVGTTTTPSFEYHQDWNTDVYSKIGDFPRMAPDATFEQKTAFGVELSNFREMALPYYMNYKCPSFFKVEACTGDYCSGLILISVQVETNNPWPSS